MLLPFVAVEKNHTVPRLNLAQFIKVTQKYYAKNLGVLVKKTIPVYVIHLNALKWHVSSL